MAFCFSDLDIVMFLQACEWDVNVTKETLESYYTNRSSLTDFFAARDPVSKEIQEIAKVMLVFLQFFKTVNITD